MTEVVALVLGRDRQARIQGGLRGRASVAFVARCAEVTQRVAAARVVAAILALRDADGVLSAPTVAELRRRFPLTPVLVLCPFAPAAGDDCVARRVLADLEGVVPAPARPALEFCVTQARQRLTVDGVARALGMHRKTLRRRLKGAGLPGPLQLIGWCRLLVAARLIEEPGRPLEHVAHDLDFPSAAALRNLLARYTGLRSREVREHGGVGCVLAAFRRVIVADARTGDTPPPWAHAG